LEATFTPYFKLLLDNEATLFAPGDERVASLFLWHFVEEVEHRSSALVVYDSLIRSRTRRVRALPAILRHVGVESVHDDHEGLIHVPE
ncbi:metal-dependent hydrolase, partial [Mycobacterium intracellulare]|uniref:metal-dependent hydrolase n=1 Tax=Mycobacterium intracellulare TaxID=1767 RepID=UPI0019150BAD